MRNLASIYLIGLALALGTISINASAGLPAQSIHPQSYSVISGNAFANSQGVISINQVAGNGNAQANSINMVLDSIKPVSNSILAQNVTVLPNRSSASPSNNLNTVAISATAFKGAEGIAQINQVSGSGNASANSFALGIAPGVLH